MKTAQNQGANVVTCSASENYQEPINAETSNFAFVVEIQNKNIEIATDSTEFYDCPNSPHELVASADLDGAANYYGSGEKDDWDASESAPPAYLKIEFSVEIGTDVDSPASASVELGFQIATMMNSSLAAKPEK